MAVVGHGNKTGPRAGLLWESKWPPCAKQASLSSSSTVTAALIGADPLPLHKRGEGGGRGESEVPISTAGVKKEVGERERKRGPREGLLSARKDRSPCCQEETKTTAC